MRTRIRVVPRAVTAGARRALAVTAVLAAGVLVAPSARASRLIVSSALNSSLLRFDGQTGAFTDLFAPSASGGLNYPEGIAFGPDGNLYVRSSGSILKFNGVTGASMGTFATSNGQDPSSYAFQVRFDSITGQLIATPATGGLDGPTGLTFGPDGNLYVSSYGSILRYSGQNGTPLGTFAIGGGLVNATGVTFGPDGNLYVSSYPGNSVLKYSGSTGAYIGTFVAPGSGGLDRPIGLAFGPAPDNTLYVCSYNTNNVLRYNGTTGAFIGVFTSGGGLNGPTGLSFGSDGNLYVASYKSSSVPRFNGATGAFMDYFVPSASNGLSGPFSVCFALEAPSNLNLGGATPTQISLSWTNNSPDDTGVEIDRKVGGAAYTVVAVVSPTTTSYTDTGLKSNTPYTYRIRAVSNTLVSGFTPEASLSTMPGTPTTPASLVATASASAYNQITLSWNAVDISNTSNFEIYRKTGGGAYGLIGTVAANVTSYNDLSCSAGTSYTYEVRAVNSSFASAYSNEATAKTLQTPPAAPTLLKATVYGPLVNLSWTDNSNNETAFEVYRKTGSGSYSLAAVLAPNSTSYFDPSAALSTTYTYRVRSANDSFASAYTNEVTITTGAQGPVNAPTGLTAVATGALVKLSWTDNSNNETAFEIYRKPAGGSYSLAGVAGANATSYADQNAAVNTTYTYRIRAANDLFASSLTSEVTVTTGSEGPVATPTGLTATVYGPLVNLSWTDNSTNETAYEVYRKPAGGSYSLAAVLAPNSTSYFDPNAALSTTYSYRVRAANNFFASNFTNEVTITTGPQGPVNAPTGLTATAAGAAVKLSWTDNSNNETAFEIYRKPAGGSYTLAGVAAPNSTSYTDQGSAANTTYSYRIRAANDLFASGFSNEVTVTTGSEGPVAAPSSLTGTAWGVQIKLSWTDNSNNETAFEIYRLPAGGTWALVGVMPPNSTGFTDTTSAAGVTYTYTVRAANNFFASPFANMVTVTAGTQGPVAAPDGLTAVAVSGTQVNLSWTDHSTNETAYEVYRKPAGGNWALIAVLPANSNSMADTNVTGGVTYTYAVRAANDFFASNFTNMPSVTTPGP